MAQLEKFTIASLDETAHKFYMKICLQCTEAWGERKREVKEKINLYLQHKCYYRTLGQRRLDPGKETRTGFFQVWNYKEYQNVVIISFVHLEKINIFCFMH